MPAATISAHISCTVNSGTQPILALAFDGLLKQAVLNDEAAELLGKTSA